MDEFQINEDTLLKLIEGDIIERNVDAIVNLANSYLPHVGGVAGATVRKEEKIIKEESRKISFTNVEKSSLTLSESLSCKAVIHSVVLQMAKEARLFPSVYH